MTAARIEEIDILKGFAILLVVLGHGIIFFPVDLHQVPWCLTLFDWLGAVHMPLFFLISGYCFTYHGNYGEHLCKKAARLVIPYVVFGLADVVPRALFASLVNRPASAAESLWKMVFRGGELWFLYVLFEMFLLVPLFYPLLCRRLSAGWIFLLCAGVLHFLPGLPETFLINRLCWYLMYFMAGCLLRQHAPALTSAAEWFRRRCLLSGALSLAAFAAWWLSFLHPFLPPRYGLHALWELLLSCLTFLFAAYALRGTPPGRLLGGWGMYSLQIYVLNGFTLVASRTLTVRILGITSPAVIVAVNLLVDLEFAYLFSRYFLSRFRVTRLLSGLRV